LGTALFAITGAGGTSALGSEVITAGATPTPTGGVLTGTLTSATVWGLYVTGDTQTWTETTTSDSDTWTEVTTNDTQTWQEAA